MWSVGGDLAGGDGFGDFASAAWGVGRGGRVEAEAKISPAFAGHFLSGADAVSGFDAPAGVCTMWQHVHMAAGDLVWKQ